MGGFINCKWFKVYIFYEHSVVGGNTYSLYTKMGARTHSAWRYNAFAKQCNCGNLSAWVKFECYIWGDIVFTQRCWWCSTKNKRQIWRRNVMRRYVLGDSQ